MKKKIISLLLAAAMVCTMAACGNSSGQENASSNAKAEESGSSDAADAAEPADAPAPGSQEGAEIWAGICGADVI